jgi:hypothetical protein
MSSVNTHVPATVGVFPALSSTVHAILCSLTLFSYTSDPFLGGSVSSAADGHSSSLFVLFHNLAFLCVAEEALGRQIPFAFLQRLKEDFLGANGKTAAGVASNRQLTYGYG